jgi:hypothetical protein
MAGFSFIKLNAIGKALTNQAGTGHACVRDNITGLIWEVKTTSGRRNKDNTYRWGGLTAIGIDHASREGNYYDDWNVLVNDANTNALCGFRDWRVANITELRSILHLGKKNPAIDQNYFPNTKSKWYWSSSPEISSTSSYSWIVNFGKGDETRDVNKELNFVRLVRGGQ